MLLKPDKKMKIKLKIEQIFLKMKLLLQVANHYLCEA